MLLCEELLLLAIGPEKGRPPFSQGSQLGPALAGALVAELALGDAVNVVEGRAVVVDSQPADDDLLDEGLRLLSSPALRSKDLKHQLTAIDKSLDLKKRVTDRLVIAGKLGEEHARVLGVVPIERHPVADQAGYLDLRQRLQGALQDDSPMHPRLAALSALLDACRLLQRVTDRGDDKKRMAARARDALDSSPSGKAVAAIVDEARSAAVLIAAAAGGS